MEVKLKELNKILESEEHIYKKIKSMIESRLEFYPNGKLKIKKSNGKTYYANTFYNENLSKSECYIGKKNINLIKSLAQKGYEISILSLIDNNLRAIEAFKKRYNFNGVESAYSNLSLERQQLVKPVLLTPQQKHAIWKARDYENKEFINEEKLIYTLKNERVRSKSEKILADLFNHMGIDYKYEKALRLSNSLTIYPDFTFLSPDGDREIYWEHLGMIDKADYILQAVERIETYHSHGIFLGDQLLLSFEGNKHLINLSYVKKVAGRYLL